MYFRYFLNFLIISPWKMLKSQTPKDAGSLKFINVLLLFQNYLPLEKDVAIHLYKLNPLHQRMIYAKFG